MTLRQDARARDAGTLVAVGQSLVAIHDWTFLLGPGFVVGIGNGLLLGYLMYRSGLVPRRMAMLGLVGGPLICASGDRRPVRRHRAGLAGAVRRDDPGDRRGRPSLGIYLTVKGFKASAPVLGGTRRGGVATPAVAAA